MSFVHLHTHTHYTFQQALGDPERLVKRAKELGQTAIAITDAGNMYGAFEFYEACKKNDVKPIVWVEFYISKKWRTNRDKDNEIFEIVLLAKNIKGYHNLIELVTTSQIEGFYNGRPRIDFELLERFSSDIIALSGSMYGEIGQHIITGKEESYICTRIEYYRTLFGRENYYLEIEEHPDRPMQPKINETILRLAKTYGYEYVGTNNAYYITPDDAEVQDMMSAVALSRDLDDPDRPTLMNGDYSIRPSRDMEEVFVYAPKACENSLKIAQAIDLQLEYGAYKIPVFPLSIDEREKYEKYKEDVRRRGDDFKLQSPEEWLLRSLCMDGLNSRYDFSLTDEQKILLLHKQSGKKSEKKLSEMSVEELYTLAESYYSDEKKDFARKLPEDKNSILRRLEYELTVVELMGFNGYFCIVADFIRYGKNNWVPVWPWRGSAAGAILAYLSGITDIDPLRYWLLFERFLNPARVTMPDIDVDFSDEWRDKVLSYVREKYGKDHVTQVCTFGTLAARAAVKDAGRALWVPFQDMNDFAKLIPGRPGITLKEALDESIELKKTYEEQPTYKKVIDAALKLEWTVRQLWVHACAVIIAPEPMKYFCPLQPPPKDPTTTVTQFSAGPLEALGLLKMDFLGLRNLAILDRSIRIVEEVHGTKINLLKIDYEDPKVLSLFGEGDMTWVFQFESAGMRRYLKDLKPSSFEDLIAMVSLYRPGPLQYIPEFIDRKFGRKVVEYPHPSLESILKPTYGIAVYQEQIMQLVQAFAGFSLGEADILRRAIGKKKYELLMEQRGKFITAAIKEWHKEELAIYIFDEIIEPFAGYGFNKSHAACYSMIAYQTAYMKTYYPTEFMTALMVSDEEDMDRIRLEIEEARMKSVNILPPDVNESRRHFTFIDNKNIRFGLKAIKWLWDWPIDTIRRAVSEKKFTDIIDFIERTGGDVINKKSLEALIYSGALDGFWERKMLLEGITKMTAYLKEVEAKKETAQMGLFDMGESIHGDTHFSLENTVPMTFEERIKWEKTVIWYPISGHPLDGIGEFVQKKSKNLWPIYEWKKKKTDIVDSVIMHDEDGSEIQSLTLDSPSSSIISDDWNSLEDETIYATLIWVVTESRSIQTKTGWTMLLARVESVWFEFRLTIFSREYEKYASKILEDRVIVVDGRVRFDNERDEISVSPATSFWKKASGTEPIKSFSISEFRAFAWVNDVPKTKEKPPTSEARFFIDIPPYWTKDDLLDLKDFLGTLEVWLVSVWIRIHGIEKDTKFSILEKEKLEEWVRLRSI
jgi:DNA polymerase III subunit alpha